MVLTFKNHRNICEEMLGEAALLDSMSVEDWIGRIPNRVQICSTPDIGDVHDITETCEI